MKLPGPNDFLGAPLPPHPVPQALLDDARDGYWQIDAHQATVYANAALAGMLGYDSPSALIGLHADRFILPEDIEAHRRELARRAAGMPGRYERRFRRIDGTVIRCLVQVMPNVGPDGVFRGASAVVRPSIDSGETARTRLARFYELCPLGIALWDDKGRLTEYNDAFARILGYGGMKIAGMRYHELTGGRYRGNHPKLVADLERLHRMGPYEKEYLHREGHWVPVRVTAMLLQEPDAPACVWSTVEDISRRKDAEEKARFAVSVFTHAREAIMIADADGNILNVNDAFLRITGYERHEIVGKNPRILQSGRHGKDFYVSMWRQLVSQGFWEGEVWNRRKNGEVFPELLTISAVRDAGGGILNYVSLFSDISVQKTHEQQMEHIAHYDALTGLPNRLLLADRMGQALARARRHGARVAIAFLDLDGFKQINDLHGHATGDRLLVALAGRMQKAIRECDTIARLGGDEFVAVFNDLPDGADYQTQVTRLLASVAEPVQIGPHTLHVTACAGVTLFPQAEEVDADQLLRQADHAMYQAKLGGRNRYSVFDTALDRSLKGRNELFEQVRQGLRRGEFELYYQPVVNLRQGDVPFAEALLRWRHPQRGLLAPGAFLGEIEDHPLIVEIGNWTFDAALGQLDAWRAEGVKIGISVNVGARQLQQPDFVAQLRARLAAHPDVQPGQLKLEVLETSALDDIGHVSQIIAACQEIGVPFALDDFGTGYSSLLYLKRLPARKIKIDQGFVRDMLDDPDDLAILEGIIGLAAAFRRDTVAEGVETLEHAELLLRLGCMYAQGYGIARPMPAQSMPGWLRDWQPPPQWKHCAPLQRDELPLLYASVEHRAWMRALEAWLAGRSEATPELDHHRCRFGLWLQGEGRQRYGHHVLFDSLMATHEAIHGFAAELISDPAADTVPPHLRALHLDLLHQLEAMRNVTAPTSAT